MFTITPWQAGSRAAPSHHTCSQGRFWSNHALDGGFNTIRLMLRLHVFGVWAPLQTAASFPCPENSMEKMSCLLAGSAQWGTTLQQRGESQFPAPASNCLSPEIPSFPLPLLMCPPWKRQHTPPENSLTLALLYTTIRNLQKKYYLTIKNWIKTDEKKEKVSKTCMGKLTMSMLEGSVWQL